MNTPQATERSIRILAVLAILFGLLTLKEGATVLFGGPGARLAAGDFVPFVLWFNFIAGFAYVGAGVGLWWRQPWAARLAIGIAVATLLVFAAFIIHIRSDGPWEPRTLVAMSLRSAIWVVIAGMTGARVLRGQVVAP
jgi:hypothetical protein